MDNKPKTAEELFKALKKPFDERLISWRIGAISKDKTKAMPLAYIDARDVMNRLDGLFGFDWQNKSYKTEGVTFCDIGLKIGEEWIWRSGAAGDTEVEAEKGAASDALKRAAVLFGVGRYLYDLPNVWLPINEHKQFINPPKLPDWATPHGYDCGLTKYGYIFGTTRMAYLQDLAKEVIKVYARTEQGENDAYKKWYGFIDAGEFNMQEEQTFAWFEMESNIRTAIKRINLQVESLKKEGK